jgi:intracellular septation protein
MITATIALIITSLISMVIVYVLSKKLPVLIIFSNLILLIFGGITIFSGNPMFIKIKPTILYLLFSSILVYDIIYKKNWLKHIFGQFFELEQQNYSHLSKQWLAYFLTCAILNELVWRNFSEQTWVLFKVFGILTLTLVFSCIQIFTLQKKLKRNI